MKSKGQIIRIKNGKWRIRLQSERAGIRKSISETIIGTRDDAKEALKDLIKDAEKAKLAPKFPFKTFNDLFDAYLEIIQPSIEEQTFYQYKRFVKAYLRPEFGTMAVTELDSLTIEKWYVELQKTYAGETIAKIHNQLKAALDKAKLWKWREDNPITGIKPPNRNKTPKGVKQPKDTLTIEELNRFFAACPDFASETMWTFFALTGARPSEVLAARWKDIDFNNQVFKVRQKLVQIKQVTKFSPRLKTTTSKRDIPLSGDLVQMLKRLKNEQNVIRLKSSKWEDNDLVFCTRYGNPFRLSNLGTDCTAIALAAKITKNITPNGFRHSLSTLADDNDLQGKAMSEILGHASRRMTENVYTHPNIEKKRRIIDKMSDLILKTDGAKRGAKKWKD